MRIDVMMQLMHARLAGAGRPGDEEVGHRRPGSSSPARPAMSLPIADLERMGGRLASGDDEDVAERHELALRCWAPRRRWPNGRGWGRGCGRRARPWRRRCPCAARDPRHLHARTELQLVAGDGGADGHADEPRLHAVRGERQLQRAAALPRSAGGRPPAPRCAPAGSPAAGATVPLARRAEVDLELLRPAPSAARRWQRRQVFGPRPRAVLLGVSWLRRTGSASASAPDQRRRCRRRRRLRRSARRARRRGARWPGWTPRRTCGDAAPRPPAHGPRPGRRCGRRWRTASPACAATTGWRAAMPRHVSGDQQTRRPTGQQTPATGSPMTAPTSRRRRCTSS